MNMYFIGLVAPEEINRPVLKWKLWLREKYGCEAALRSPAHITLIPPFWMDPGLENSLVASLAVFTASQDSFDTRLKGFSGFEPQVLFVDVVPDNRLTELKENLVAWLTQDGRYPLKKDERAFHPHITLATRDLHKKAFFESRDLFYQKKYEARWTVTGISLLKHNKKNWDVATTSQFK